MQATVTLEQNANDTGWAHRTPSYKNGYIARMEGFSKAAQPHGKHTTAAAHWVMGWRKADADLARQTPQAN